jgi:hypothetical protein
MKKVLIFSLLFLSHMSGNAQVLNVDREIQEDSSRKKFDLVGGVFLSSDKQKNNVVDLSTRFEGDLYFKNKYMLLGLFRNDAVFNGKQTIQNEGTAHIRYRDMDKRKFSPEYYIQYQWNGAWGMEYRNLAGTNLRVKWLDISGLDLYTGHGIFGEQERWNWKGVKSENLPDIQDDKIRRMFRFNHYVKISTRLSSIADLTTISYFQFPLQGRFLQPRWFLESNLTIKAGEHFGFLIHWDHIRDKNRLVPIESFYYTISTGVQFNY